MADYIRLAVERLDAGAFNRIRFISILLSALVFGVFLRNRAPVSAPRSAQFAMVVASEPAARHAASASVRDAEFPSREAGGDAVPSTPVLFPRPAEENSAVHVRQEPLSLSARAAIVIHNKMPRAPAYQKNIDVRLPFASLTKLMTAVVAVEYGKSDDIVAVSKSAVTTEGVSGGLVIGEKLTVADMLKVMLIVSSNDAAIALKEYFAARGLDLVVLMNEKAARLGMADTHFANVSGLDAIGHYATARDLGVLTAYSMTHENIWDILSQKSAAVVSADGRFTHQLIANNELVRKGVPRVKGGKTGYTENALGCMITVLEDGSIIVVLGSNNREAETEKLIGIMGTRIH